MTKKLLSALTVAVVIAAPATAFGHAKLVATAPANGQSVRAPGSVTVVFDDIVQAPNHALVVTGPSGQNAVSGYGVVGEKTLAGTLEPNLPAGRYVATWKIVADDGHLETGSFRFQIAGSPAPGKHAATVTPRVPATTTSTGGKTSTATIVLIAALAAIATAALGVAFAGSFRTAHDRDRRRRANRNR